MVLRRDRPVSVPDQPPTIPLWSSERRASASQLSSAMRYDRGVKSLATMYSCREAGRVGGPLRCVDLHLTLAATRSFSQVQPGRKFLTPFVFEIIELDIQSMNLDGEPDASPLPQELPTAHGVVLCYDSSRQETSRMWRWQ